MFVGDFKNGIQNNSGLESFANFFEFSGFGAGLDEMITKLFLVVWKNSVVHGFENQSDYEKILWCMALKISQIMKAE